MEIDQIEWSASGVRRGVSSANKTRREAAPGESNYY
jgi:hypothetical protein